MFKKCYNATASPQVKVSSPLPTSPEGEELRLALRLSQTFPILQFTIDNPTEVFW